MKSKCEQTGYSTGLREQVEEDAGCSKEVISSYIVFQAGLFRYPAGNGTRYFLADSFRTVLLRPSITQYSLAVQAV